MFQNHPVMCWQVVQMSGMRITEHLCLRKLGVWAPKQPALYFIYLHFDRAISPVSIILLLCFEFQAKYFIYFPGSMYILPWVLIFHCLYEETKSQRFWIAFPMHWLISTILIFLGSKLWSFYFPPLLHQGNIVNFIRTL